MGRCARGPPAICAPTPTVSRTNEAVRFTRTLPGRWAYGATYRDSLERKATLADWLDWYYT